MDKTDRRESGCFRICQFTPQRVETDFRHACSRGPDKSPDQHPDGPNGRKGSDCLCRRKKAEHIPAPEIGAEGFKYRSQHAVGSHIHPEHRTGKGTVPEKEDQEDGQHEIGERRIDLGGVKCHAEGSQTSGIGEGDGPGKIRRSPVAASGHEASDPADAMAKGKPRCQTVAEIEDGKPSFPEQHECGNGGGDETAVEDQPPLPEFENGQRVAPEGFRRGRHIEDPCPDNPCQHHPDGHIGDDVRIEIDGSRQPPGKGDSRHDSERHHQPVGVEGEISNGNENRMHAFLQMAVRTTRASS